MNIIEIYKRFPDEQSCIEHLERARWRGMPKCPYCKSTSASAMPKENRYHCNGCNTSFSVTIQTIFHKTKLPLQKWFLAISLILNAKKGISARQLGRDLMVTKDTAWYVAMRIRKAMADEQELLNGIVEMDETYVGGKEKNKHANKRLKAGRGTIGKLAIAGMYQRPEKVRAFLIVKPDRKTIHKLVRRHIGVGSTLYTDEHSGYSGLNEYTHFVIRHSAGEYVRGRIHTNGIEPFWALLKRGTIGQYHKVSIAYLSMYINEFCYRYNNRSNTSIFDDTIGRAIGDTCGQDHEVPNPSVFPTV